MTVQRHWPARGEGPVNRQRFHYQFNRPLKYGLIDNPFETRSLSGWRVPITANISMLDPRQPAGSGDLKGPSTATRLPASFYGETKMNRGGNAEFGWNNSFALWNKMGRTVHRSSIRDANREQSRGFFLAFRGSVLLLDLLFGGLLIG